MKRYVIADAHMGAETPEREALKRRRLITFFNHVENEKAHLILCGDLFDFWFEYRSVIPRQHFRLLSALADLLEAGIRVDYLAGNHDFWLDSFLRNELGIIVHDDELEIEHGGRRLFLLHGDGLLKKDYLYRLLKRILRNPRHIFLYKWLHPDLGIPLAHLFSRWSRDSSLRDEKLYTDSDYRAFARQKIENGTDMVVLGHTHIAAREKIESGWYLNPGAWMQTFSYLVIDEEQDPQLFQWNGEAGVIYDPPTPPLYRSRLGEEGTVVDASECGNDR